MKAEDVTPPPRTAMPLVGDIKQKAAGAAADVEALEIHDARLYALLQACIHSRATDGTP